MQIWWFRPSIKAEILATSKGVLNFWNPRSYKYHSHVITVALLAVLLLATRIDAFADESTRTLNRVAHQATNDLAAGDWNQFRKFCGTEIDFIEYTHTFHTPNNNKEIDSPIFRELKIPPRDLAVLITCHYKINMHHLNATDIKVLKTIQEGVKISIAFPNHAWIGMDYDKRQSDGPGVGPAMVGKWASSTVWRMEFSKINGAWKVTALVVENYPLW